MVSGRPWGAAKKDTRLAARLSHCALSDEDTPHESLLRFPLEIATLFMAIALSVLMPCSLGPLEPLGLLATRRPGVTSVGRKVYACPLMLCCCILAPSLSPHGRVRERAKIVWVVLFDQACTGTEKKTCNVQNLVALIMPRV